MTEQQKTHLIVVGASAGGVEALTRMVAHLPQDLAAPVVVAQHMDPRRVSHLVEILARVSTLPVSALEDGEQLAPSHVYLVPPNTNVKIRDHRAVLLTDGARPLPSVDMLFTTAAESYGEGLIAIILSGSGSDGSEGARVVKRAGGMVIVQNPATAGFSSMPESLAPSTIDVTAEAQDIGPLLPPLLAGSFQTGQVAESEPLDALLREVSERSGVDFSRYKSGTIRRRLGRRIVATKTENLASYVAYLGANPEEYQRLASSFLIKVTEFMRDPDLFAHLRSTVLPELLARARAAGRTSFRVWSAGCATGEEPYSIAILLSDLLGEALDGMDVRIFATDLDEDAVSFARRGTYAPAQVQHLSPATVQQNFTRVGESFQVRKRLRALTIFGQHDLAQRAPFPAMDLVLCRNVLIYFAPELQRRTLQLFAFSLRPGGILVLGKAETRGSGIEHFTPAHPEFAMYRRTSGPAFMPVGRFATPSTMPRAIPRRGQPGFSETARSRRELHAARKTTDGLVHALPIGVVLVDEHYDIQEINAAARRLLAIHSPAIGEDFVHLMPAGVPPVRLREAIDAVVAGAAEKTLEDVVIETLEVGRPTHLRLTFSPVTPASDDEAARGSVLIVVQDFTALTVKTHELAALSQGESELAAQLADKVTALDASNSALRDSNARLEKANGALEEGRARAEEAQAHAERVLERLTGVNRELLASNERLARANDAMRSANEELLLTTEEAQSAMEEVETLNEELQSSNEELETVNEELQATIEELNATNADMESRSQELNDLAKLQERFIAMASHELRTPLVPLLGCIDIMTQLMGEGPADPRLTKLLASARGAVLRIRSLIHDLLEATRLQTGKLHLRMQEVELEALVQRTLPTVELRGQQLRVSSAGPLWVHADPARIEQVLVNLVTNSVTHAPGSSFIDVRLRREAEHAVLEVEDRGPGVPAADLPRLFTSYFQVERLGIPSDGGLGLGLFICKEIVTAHGGTMTVHSVEGEGATFTASLPLAGPLV